MRYSRVFRARQKGRAEWRCLGGDSGKDDVAGAGGVGRDGRSLVKSESGWSGLWCEYGRSERGGEWRMPMHVLGQRVRAVVTAQTRERVVQESVCLSFVMGQMRR